MRGTKRDRGKHTDTYRSTGRKMEEESGKNSTARSMAKYIGMRNVELRERQDSIQIPSG